MDEHHHRSTFQRPNKPFKHGKHKSGRELSTKSKEVTTHASVSNPKNRVALPSKKERVNQAKQIMRNKRQKVIERKRAALSNSPPTIVAIIPLHRNVDTEEILNQIIESIKQNDSSSISDEVQKIEIDGENDFVSAKRMVSIRYNQSRFTFIQTPRDVFTLLDHLKVLTIALVVLPGDGSPVDETGNRFLSIMRAQGMPSVIGAIQGLSEIPQKKRHGIKAELTKFIEFECPNISPRVVSLDNVSEAQQCLRFLSSTSEREIAWKSSRPHLLVESLKWKSENDENKTTEELSIRGYLRGCPLSAQQLIHIPGAGDFRIIRIKSLEDPFPLKKKHKSHKHQNESDDIQMSEGGDSSSTTGNNDESTVGIVDERNVFSEEDLKTENEIDTLGNEQTWPTQEELDETKNKSSVNGKNSSKGGNQKKKADYEEFRKAWVVDEEDEDEEDDEDEDEGEDGQGEKKERKYQLDEESVGTMTQTDNQTEMGDDFSEMEEDLTAEQMNARKKDLKKASRAEHEDDINFPDEVDTPTDIHARERFARYRGLKSFRTSPWDPKENLPLDYSRTTAFENLKRTFKRVSSEFEDSPIKPGMYIEIIVEAVPKSIKDVVNSFCEKNQLVVVGLFSYEHRLGVVHFRLTRHPDYEDPIRSKQLLIVHCGFRTFFSKLTFSEDNPNCEKHKMERFFHPHRTVVGSAYGPVIFPPAPVLVFVPAQETLSTTLQLLSVKGADTEELFSSQAVNNQRFEKIFCRKTTLSPTLSATGTCLGIDPDRIALKKIILSGFTIRAKKRHAVVRYMFFNPEDVRWFKPVDLWTKRGRKGHIRESVGTHGSFKAIFDGTLSSNDVICMSLYKRAFPKYMPLTYTAIQYP